MAERKDRVQKNAVKILAGAMALMVVAATMAACNQANQPETEPAESIAPTEAVQNATEPEATLPLEPEDADTQPPTQPPVEVEMPDYVLSYSGEMAAVIRCEEQPENGGLQFFVELNEGKTPIYTLYLNRIEGDLVVMKKNAAGEEIPVTFLMEPIPENLSAGEETTFCMAQETVNDVINSLVLK